GLRPSSLTLPYLTHIRIYHQTRLTWMSNVRLWGVKGGLVTMSAKDPKRTSDLSALFPPLRGGMGAIPEPPLDCDRKGAENCMHGGALAKDAPMTISHNLALNPAWVLHAL